jgi:hypothetical protein
MVVLVTWNRPQEVRRTIRALHHYLSYKGTVRLHIADDGSRPGYLDEIRADFPPRWIHSVSVTPHQGWAANVNQALRQVFAETPYVFLIEDDYVARRPVDLSRGVALLEAAPRLGLIRYDGVEGHQFILHLCEAETMAGRVHYLWVRKESPATYVYSNRPHLVHRRFHAHYGYYSTGLALGSVEMVFAEKVKMTEGPEIAVLSDGIDRAFDHVGHSWKGGPYDRGKELVYE